MRTNKQKEKEKKEKYIAPRVDVCALFMEQMLMASKEVEGTTTGDTGMTPGENDGDIDWPFP
jgi:hypothetical protein